MDCPCKSPGWCEPLMKNLVGRLWDICQGTNVNPDLRNQYLALWERQAKLARARGSSVPLAARKPCNCGGK